MSRETREALYLIVLSLVWGAVVYGIGFAPGR